MKRNRLDWLLLCSLVLSGCGEGVSGGTTSASETDSSSSSDTGSDTFDVATSITATSSGSDTADTTESAAGLCKATCQQPQECCPPEVVDCPGDYPNNWACEAGLCRSQGCMLDEHCTLDGTLPQFECHAIDAVGRCFEPCQDDAGCVHIPGSACDGLADDGARYCQTGCSDDLECNGLGVCAADGTCRCRDDNDCSGQPNHVCVL